MNELVQKIEITQQLQQESIVGCGVPTPGQLGLLLRRQARRKDRGKRPISDGLQPTSLLVTSSSILAPSSEARGKKKEKEATGRNAEKREPSEHNKLALQATSINIAHKQREREICIQYVTSRFSVTSSNARTY